MSQKNSKQCILAIDDTPMHLRVLIDILSPVYDVKVAKSGTAGLEMLQKYNVDIILLDLFMPGMSGFEVLSKLKESDDTKQIPVIFITGSDSPNDEVRGLNLGAVDYIRKPFVEAVVKLRVGVHLKLVAQMKIIEKFSLTDGLTGINNRHNFDQAVKLEWNRAIRAKENLGVLLADIDNFKLFNSRYGHLNGDACLKTVANVMKETVMRGNDFVFRWGGEEFVVLLPDTSLDGAVIVAERIRENVAAAVIQCGEETTSATISIGAGSVRPFGQTENFEDFYAKLDKVLYRAKENGRNRVEKLED